MNNDMEKLSRFAKVAALLYFVFLLFPALAVIMNWDAEGIFGSSLDVACKLATVIFFAFFALKTEDRNLMVASFLILFSFLGGYCRVFCPDTTNYFIVFLIAFCVIIKLLGFILMATNRKVPKALKIPVWLCIILPVFILVVDAAISQNFSPGENGAKIINAAESIFQYIAYVWMFLAFSKWLKPTATENEED